MFARLRGVLHADHSPDDSDDYELLLPSSSDSNGHVSQPSNGSIASSPYASRRRRTKLIKYIKHFCTLRRLLFAVALVPILLVAAVLWSGIPPDFKDVREYERRLPQHNGNDAMARGDRYLRFPGHLWGHGLNNVLQEALLMSYLAYEANRSYVFEDYVWSHTPFSYTLYDFALRPARIPLNAFISGPTAGGPMPDVAAAVSSSFFEKVCPKASRKVISSRDAPTDAEGSMLIKWWVDKLETVPDRCVEVDSSEKVVFDRFLFGGPRILSILPGMFSSPILSRFSWSPLVLSAITRNFAVLRPQNLDVLLYSPHAGSRVFSASSSLKQSASTDDSSSTSESHTSISTSSSSSSSSSSTSDSSTYPPMFEGMLAVHIRRGDYKRHCPRLAQWHSNYMGIAQLPGLPDRFDPSSFDHDEGIAASSTDDEVGNERDGNTDPEDTPHTREEYYLAHCLPSVSQIVKRLSAVRREHNLQQQNQDTNMTLALPPLSKVYVLTNGWSFWLSQLFESLKADGWEDVVSSFNVEGNLDREQKYVGMAVDMAIAERAEVFVGNGFSSLSANIILLRMARGMDIRTNRFL
ncbi:hypothetical protein PC9H_011857 [Pleurotus ostreatus]|uniref:Uncharacterized protein n=1 Tax=Pleurotus ostreatus TaxID=5322 RepID=A0A8H7DPM0_PLEOS|nr:uncharacterized protein PC9H_011857 [Pleurotus ostreatus]KAF7421334.1 hypothetical protein PC9H_011857 [Pleurotus ostreatus]